MNRDEEILTRGLRALAEEMETLGAPDELETKLVKAFRARQVVTPIARRRLNASYWPVALAAMLLIAISIVVVHWNRDKVDTPRQAITHTEPQKTPENKKISDESRNDVQYQAVNSSPQRSKPRRPRPSSLRRPENQVANHATSEIATDFIPLTYMNAASLQDGGQIIRVELPRSALANFGLPVNMDRYNEKVKADVLLGVDGMAHAIRFVQ
jgi:hypothetical protein